MADNNQQNPQQSTNSNERLESKELLSALKERLRLEGDYRDLIKDSIRELNNQIKTYDKINARVETLNRSSVNTKSVESEIKKAKESSYLSGLKMEELEIKMGKSRKEAQKDASSYNKIIESRLSQEAKLRTQISEVEKLKNKIKKDDQTAADQYVQRLDIQKNLVSQITEARKKGNSNDVKDLADKLRLNASEIQSLDSKMSLETKEYAQKLKAIDASENELDSIKEKLRVQNSILSEEELAYIEAQKRDQLSEKELEKLNQKLVFEKKVNDNLGVTGNLVKIFADKLGVGNSVYEAMVERSRKLEENAAKTGEKYSSFAKTLSVLSAGLKAGTTQLVKMAKDPAVIAAGTIAAAKGLYSAVSGGLDMVGKAAKSGGDFIAGLSKHSATFVRDLIAPLTNLLEKIPLIGGLVSGLVQGFAAILDLVLGIEDYAVRTGRAIGLGANESLRLYRNYANLSASFKTGNRDLAITTDQMMESYVQLSKQLGVNKGITDQMVIQNVLMQKRLGLGEQETQSLNEVSLINKTTNEDIVKLIFTQTQLLQKETGIAFNFKEVIKNAASLSGRLGLQFAMYPAKLTSSLQIVKSLGMDLQKLDSIADGFLDFESSIAKEFEAQLITGKEINLDRARQLFLENDLAGAAMEISKYTGSSADFLKMNRIEASSLATAMQMSTGEMADFLKQQEKYRALGIKNDREMIDRLKRLKEQGNLEEISLLRQQAASKGATEAFDDLFKKSKLEVFEDSMNKVKEILANLFINTRITDFIQNIANFISDENNMKNFIDTLIQGTSKFVEYLGKGLGLFGDLIYEVLNGIDQMLQSMGMEGINKTVLKNVKVASDTVKFVTSETAKEVYNQQNAVKSGEKQKMDLSSQSTSEYIQSASKSAEADVSKKKAEAGISSFMGNINEEQLQKSIESFTSQQDFLNFVKEYNKGRPYGDTFEDRMYDALDWYESGITDGIKKHLKSININLETDPGVDGTNPTYKFVPFARGGLVNKPVMGMVGERGRKEGILPLEDTQAMQTISDAIVKGIISSTYRSNTSNSTTQSERNKTMNINLKLNNELYAGTQQLGTAVRTYALQYNPDTDITTGLGVPSGG